MASALASQLARIAASSNNSLNLKAQRAAHATSLVFARDVAVSQDFDTLYFICYESFAELCKLDKRFLVYNQTIFAEQSKQYERDQMTAADNESLNKNLESFLGLVGGRLLLRPALRALEWLVRRFRVHEYNTASLILTFLPYHSNAIFANLLRILPTKLTPAFHFLHAYRKDESLPPIQAITYNAATVESFSTALNDYVIKVFKVGHGHHALVSFWSSVETVALSQILDSAKSGRYNVQKERQENVLTKLLPVISQALQIRDSPDLRTAVYIILLILGSKAQLQPKLILTLIESILLVLSDEDQNQALICMGSLAQTLGLQSLTPRALKLFLSKRFLIVTMSSLASKYPMDKLQIAILLALGDKGQNMSPEESDFFTTLIQNEVLNKDQISLCFNRLLSKTSTAGLDGDSQAMNSVLDLLQPLARSVHTKTALASAAYALNFNLDAVGISIDYAGSLSSDKDQDTMEIDSEDRTQSQRERSQELLASLTDTSIEKFAAMSLKDKSSLYGNLREAFLLASADDADRLSQLPFFQQQSVADSSAVSFLVRLWCGSDPVNCRAAAITVASKIVQASQPETPDFQALIPYLLAVLNDPSRKIRQAASELITTIEKRFSSSPPYIWGQKDLYEYANGHEENLWLRSKDAKLFISRVILPHLAECVADGAFVTHLLKNSFLGEAQGDTDNRQDLKTSLKLSVIKHIAAHAICSPIMIVKIRLVNILLPVRKISNQHISTFLIPLLQSWASLDATAAKRCCVDEDLDESAVDNVFCSIISGNEKLAGLDILKSFMNGSTFQIRSSLLAASAARLVSIWPDLKESTRADLAVCLLDVGFSGKPEFASVALSSLRSVSKSEAVFSALLDMVQASLTLLPEAPRSKRRRVDRENSASSIEINEDDLSVAIRRLNFVLESIDSADVQHGQTLASKLFSILEDLYKIQKRTGASITYVQGLLYDTLVTCFEGAENSQLDLHASAVHADILVEYIQTTSSPQARNSALLLITAIANTSPSLILHSIMPIFTFVGTNLLTQDDASSRAITGKLITQVIPAIINAQQNADSGQNRVLEILKSFVAALPHIPTHRIVPVYSDLLKALGPGSSLGIFITLLSQEREADRASARTTKVELLLKAFSAQYTLDVMLLAIQSTLVLVGDALSAADESKSIPWMQRQNTEKERKTVVENILSSVESVVDSLTTEEILETTTSGAYNFAMADVIKTIVTLQSQTDGKLANQLESILEIFCAISHGSQLATVLPLVLENMESTQSSFVFDALSKLIESSHKSRKDLRLLTPELIRCTLSYTASKIRRLRKSSLNCLKITIVRYGKTDKVGSQTALSNLLAIETKDLERIRCINVLIQALGEAVSPSLSQLGPFLQSWTKKESGKTEPDNARLQALLASLLSLCNATPWYFAGETLTRTIELVKRVTKLPLSSESSGLAGKILEQLQK